MNKQELIDAIIALYPRNITSEELVPILNEQKKVFPPELITEEKLTTLFKTYARTYLNGQSDLSLNYLLAAEMSLQLVNKFISHTIFEEDKKRIVNVNFSEEQNEYLIRDHETGNHIFQIEEIMSLIQFGISTGEENNVEIDEDCPTWYIVK